MPSVLWNTGGKAFSLQRNITLTTSQILPWKALADDYQQVSKWKLALKWIKMICTHLLLNYPPVIAVNVFFVLMNHLRSLLISVEVVCNLLLSNATEMIYCAESLTVSPSACMCWNHKKTTVDLSSGCLHCSRAFLNSSISFSFSRALCNVINNLF